MHYKEVTEYIYPKKTSLLCGNGKYLDLLKKERFLQTSFSESESWCFQKGSSILLDFGREISGGIRLLIGNGSSLGGEKITLHIVFGESLSEALSDVNSSTATNDHSIRDMVVEIPSLSDATFGQTGFRFVRLEFLSGDGQLLGAVAAYKHTEQKIVGKFTSSDKLLDKIFSVACQTVYMNVQNGYVWDGIKRDRLVWIGDIYPETLALTCILKDNKHIVDSLDFAAETNGEKWMNGIPTYSMWWIIVCYEYYLKTGDISFVKNEIEHLNVILSLFYKTIDKKGNIDFNKQGLNCGMEYFIDWPSYKKEGVKTGVLSLLVKSLDCAQKLYDVVGLDASRIKELLSIISVPEYRGELKQIHGIVAFGNAESAEIAAKHIEQGGVRGFSTFMSYFLLKPIALSGKIDTAIEFIKEYYGAMLSKGATSFFEDFNTDWIEDSGRIDRKPKRGQKDFHADYGDYCYKGLRHSLCHGWSSGIVQLYFDGIMGIEIVEPGYKKIKVKPNLGNLEFAHCTLPTPFGSLKINAYKSEGKTVTEYISVPKGIEIIE